MVYNLAMLILPSSFFRSVLDVSTKSLLLLNNEISLNSFGIWLSIFSSKNVKFKLLLLDYKSKSVILTANLDPFTLFEKNIGKTLYKNFSLISSTPHFI